MMKSTLTALLIVALSTPALAQPSSPSPSIREAAHHAALTEPLGQNPQPQRSWVVEHPIATGTLVGAAVGAAVGFATCPSVISESNYDCRTDGARGLGAVWYAAWGAGFGALTGLVIKLALR